VSLLCTPLGSRGESRGERRRSYSIRGYCSQVERGRGPAARAVRGAGNAGHGASPTSGKREGFSERCWAERIESRGAAATDALQYPRRYSAAGIVHVGESGRGPAARAVRCTENAGRGALPTAGKREVFSF
jgi:hypothetical protein